MQEPQGFLQTELIIDVVTHFLSMAAKSILQPKIGPENPPVGLYSLILTAVSHHMIAWILYSWLDRLIEH